MTKDKQPSLLQRRADLSVSVNVPTVSGDLISNNALPSSFKPSHLSLKSPFPSTTGYTYNMHNFGATSPSTSHLLPSAVAFFSPRTGSGEFIERIAALPSPSALKLFPSPLCPENTMMQKQQQQQQSFASVPQQQNQNQPMDANGKRKVDAFGRDNSFGLRTNSELERRAVEQMMAAHEHSESNSTMTAHRVDQLLSPMKRACLSPLSSPDATDHGYENCFSDLGEQLPASLQSSKRNADSDVNNSSSRIKASASLNLTKTATDEARLNRDRRMRIRAMKAIKRSIKITRGTATDTIQRKIYTNNNNSSGSFSLNELPEKPSKPAAPVRKESKSKYDDEAALSERLLRNREAAFKSRQAAKEKMETLQRQHGELQNTVGTLKDENMTLKSQVEALTKKVALLSSLAVNHMGGGQRRAVGSPRLSIPPTQQNVLGHGLESPRNAVYYGGALSPRSAAIPGSQGFLASPRR